MFFRKKDADPNKELKEEYNLIRNEIAIRDISDKSFIKLEGKDTLDFLHRISTNHVKDLKNSEVKKTLFLNDKGRIIDKTTLLIDEENYLLLGSVGNGYKLKRWLEKYIIMEDIKIEDSTETKFKFELIGKSSVSLLTQIFGNQFELISESNFLKFRFDGMELLIFKNLEKNNTERFILIGDAEYKEQLIEKIKENDNLFKNGFIGEDVYNIYRIEEGIPDTINEINDNFIPNELELLSEVDFTKGCYIGQEIIARLDTYDKVQKGLGGIEFDDEEIEGETFRLLIHRTKLLGKYLQ